RLVQPVDVLRHHRLHAAQPLERGDRLVGGVGPGGEELSGSFGLVLPVLDAFNLGGEEFVEVHGLAAGPHAVGAAEVGNAAAGGDAGAGEHQDAPGSAKELDEG